MRKISISLILFLLVSISNLSAQTILYVSLSGSNTPPYSSWATAATNIQNAVNAASATDLILVDDGTYILTASISVTKGVAIRSVNGYTSTTIDGNHVTQCLYINNASAVIDGFTITNGYNPSGFGGGANIVSGGTIQNCFISNSQARDGGGVAIDNSGTVQNCILTGNNANNNSGSGYGGGIRMLNGGTTRNCLVYGNSSANYGGGINIWSAGTIQNCTVVNNTAPNGAGVRCRSASVMQNSIVYFNNGLNWQTNGSGQSFINNCTTPILPWGSGNITDDPQFVNFGTGDYHLASSSTLIDVGLNEAWMIGAKDLDGNDRIFNTTVDIGAYEYRLLVVDPPTLLVPSDHAVNVPIETSLSWSVSPNADDYYLEVDDTPGFISPIISQFVGNTTSYLFSGNYNNLYYWRVYAKNTASGVISSWSSEFLYFTKLEVPTLVSPGGPLPDPGIPTNYPLNLTLDWNPVTGAFLYRVQLTLATDTGFSSPIIDTWAGYGETSFSVTNLQYWTSYIWRVYAHNATTLQSSDWSTPFIFATTLAPPILISPANNATGISINPTLSWHRSNGAHFYTYEIYSDPACTNLVVLGSTPWVPADTSVTVSTNLANSTDYYWRVKAVSVVSSGDYSEVRKFTTIGEAMPILSWPIGGTALYTTSITFSWYVVMGGPGLIYDLLYSTNPNMASPTIVSDLTITSYTLSGFQPGTTYYWQIRTKTSGGVIVSYSSTESFISAGVAIVPIPSWPIGNATVYTYSPTLYWYLNEAGVGLTYELELREGPITSLTGTPTILNISSMSATATSLSSGIQYSWQVRSKSGSTFSNWSTPVTFQTVTGSSGPVVPIPSWPIGYATVYTTSPSLYWYLGTSSTGLTFEVEYVDGLATSFSGTPNITNISTLYTSLNGLVAGHDYKWRVRSTNGITYSSWSPEQSFRIEGSMVITPVVPIPSWPIGSAFVYSSSTILNWYIGTVSTGLTFDVEYSSGSLTGTSTISGITTLNTQISGLISGTTYYWRVRSSTGIDTSPWSATQNFQTVNNATLATTPVLSWPIGGTTVYTTSPLLSWFLLSSSVGITYELQYSTASNMAGAITVTGLTSMQYTLSGLTSGAMYYWRVRSFDGMVYSSYSSIGSFATAVGYAAVIPINASPVGDVVLQTSLPTLSWYLPTNAETSSFEIQYSKNPEMADARILETTSTSAKINGLESGVPYYWRVRSIKGNGTTSSFSNIEKFTTVSITSVENEKEIPQAFDLKQNYPNPFNPTTIISYQLPIAGFVSLKVYDMLGREVATLVDKYQPAGVYQSEFRISDSDYSTGIYFYQLTSGSFSTVRKMMLVK